MRRTGRGQRKAKFTPSLFSEKCVTVPHPGKEVGEMLNTLAFQKHLQCSNFMYQMPFRTLCIKGISSKTVSYTSPYGLEHCEYVWQ